MVDGLCFSFVIILCFPLLDPCAQLNCTEDEWCGEKNGVYGCLCYENQTRTDSFGETHSTTKIKMNAIKQLLLLLWILIIFWLFSLSDFSETCERSSGSMSLSRCQLFEAGFPSDILHLNDPNCRGTVRNGRVEFYFDNNDHICGTSLVVGWNHCIHAQMIKIFTIIL